MLDVESSLCKIIFRILGQIGQGRRSPIGQKSVLVISQRRIVVYEGGGGGILVCDL